MSGIVLGLVGVGLVVGVMILVRLADATAAESAEAWADRQW
jgi:hypothetical protein